MPIHELTLREIQNSSLEILKKIHLICVENDFKYFLMYGTLIGAIRHKGFIPWDDDLDIAMPRDDYDKLMDYWERHEKELKPFKLFTYSKNRDYPYGLARISDVRYRLIPENEKECGLGTFIDIYVIDGLGNDLDFAKKKKREASCLSSMAYLSSRDHFARDNTHGTGKMIIKFPAYLLSKIIGERNLLNKLSEYARLFPYDQSKYVSNIVWSTASGLIFQKEWFEDIIDIPFENGLFKAPAMYHELLTFMYGDYMMLPPENRRVQQHFYRIFTK